jgi:hypothetical protein
MVKVHAVVEESHGIILYLSYLLLYPLCQAAMINENIEENLFSMLDGETDSEYVTITFFICVIPCIIYLR